MSFHCFLYKQHKYYDIVNKIIFAEPIRDQLWLVNGFRGSQAAAGCSKINTFTSQHRLYFNCVFRKQLWVTAPVWRHSVTHTHSFIHSFIHSWSRTCSWPSFPARVLLSCWTPRDNSRLSDWTRLAAEGSRWPIRSLEASSTPSRSDCRVSVLSWRLWRRDKRTLACCVSVETRETVLQRQGLVVFIYLFSVCL